METSVLFLVHPYGADQYNCMADLREAFEKWDGHCQAVHQGYYEDGTPFRIIMAAK
jgi:hypothetical protein